MKFEHKLSEYTAFLKLRTTVAGPQIVETNEWFNHVKLPNAPYSELNQTNLQKRGIT